MTCTRAETGGDSADGGVAMRGGARVVVWDWTAVAWDVARVGSRGPTGESRTTDT